MNNVYFSLGSNQGNRIGFLKQALNALKSEIGESIRESSFFETEPWGFSTENYFINQVVLIQTSMPVQEILGKILSIEKKLGRTRPENHQFYTNRNIDIDILFYADQIYNFRDLVVPHRYCHERRFVLEPLNEIAPEYIHPLLRLPVYKLLQSCTDQSLVRKSVFTGQII